MKMNRLSFAVLLAALLLSVRGAAADECTADRLKALGKYEAALANCGSQEAKKSGYDGAACRDKAFAKFQAAVTKAGACSGSQPVCEAVATTCDAATADAVPATAPDKCAAAKRKAAGKFASSLLACHAVSANKGEPVDAACLDKASGKLADALAKAGACTDGGSLPDTLETACVDSAVLLDSNGIVATACPDEDECALGTDNCDANATCANLPVGFSCTCNAGWGGDGATCSDSDECTAGTDNCDANAACTNTPGSFTCTCDAGFTGDGVTCTDIDECTLATDDCDANATCTNTPGSFSCACNGGFAGDGTSCTATLSCPCWDTYSYETLAAAITGPGLALPNKTCQIGPQLYYAKIGAETVPFQSSASYSLLTMDVSGVGEPPACCNYIAGSPEFGCSTLHDVACYDELVALQSYIGWCP